MIPEDVIIKHLAKVYEFKITPCSLPRNSWQENKRNLYIFIKGSKNSIAGIYNQHTNFDSKVVSLRNKIFKFLMKKFPIKFLDKHPDGSIWFEKRNLERKLEYELVFKPVPPELGVNGITEKLIDYIIAEDYDEFEIDW